jgi:predicted nucleic acid-binding protein
LSRVFADTSALYALLVATDAKHAAAATVFRGLLRDQSPLITTSYVLVELYALLARRVGVSAVAAFRTEFAPLLEVVWVESSLHERGLDLLIGRGNPDLSLVDAVSFVVLRQQQVESVFAYDRHFAREGFNVL